MKITIFKKVCTIKLKNQINVQFVKLAITVQVKIYHLYENKIFNLNNLYILKGGDKKDACVAGTYNKLTSMS